MHRPAVSSLNQHLWLQIGCIVTIGKEAMRGPSSQFLSVESMQGMKVRCRQPIELLKFSKRHRSESVKDCAAKDTERYL